jgi:DNA-binding transcriptional ArsR family regulator
MTAAEAAFSLRVFGDGTRLRILAALAHHELSVSQLARLLRCPFKRASRHLRYLRAREVVEARAAGNSVVYRLAPPQNSVHKRMLAALFECADAIDEFTQDGARLRQQRR